MLTEKKFSDFKANKLEEKPWTIAEWCRAIAGVALTGYLFGYLVWYQIWG